MKRLACLSLLYVLSCNLPAATLAVEVEIPQIDVAEYHRPYVAVWIEREDGAVAANLAVWYQQARGQKRPQKAGGGTGSSGGPGQGSGGGGEKGSTWLPDLRQWWRRSGRTLRLPVDGVTGATRPVGLHTLEFSDAQAPLKDLAAGHYRLVVEAVREVGGRELARLAFDWPPQATIESSAHGQAELGRIALRLTP